jgi:hypothetical protein
MSDDEGDDDRGFDLAALTEEREEALTQHLTQYPPTQPGAAAAAAGSAAGASASAAAGAGAGAPEAATEQKSLRSLHELWKLKIAKLKGRKKVIKPR